MVEQKRTGETPEQELPFSESAIQVIEIAKEEAIKHNFNNVTPDHLLLALMQDEVIKNTLSEIGINPDEVRTAIDNVVQTGKNTYVSPIEKVGFTLLTQELISLSVTQAKIFHRQEDVTPFNLLSACLVMNLGLGVSILQQSGLNKETLDQVRDLYIDPKPIT